MYESTRASRRTVLKLLAGTVVAAGAGAIPRLLRAAPAGNDGFIDVSRVPDAVIVVTEGLRATLRAGGDIWDADTGAGGAQVTTRATPGVLSVSLAAGGKTSVTRIQLRWNGSTDAWKHVLGDQWERAYGDLQWRSPRDRRIAPWYLLAHTENGTHGVGVRTQPNAFCGWSVDADGLVLTCDVRSGGVGVQLGDRVLHVCDVVARAGRRDESPFAAACAFCRELCPNPRMPDHTVYGFNDWYYAYGRNTPAGLLADAEVLAELSTSKTNRPYCVIDDGWQTKEKVDGGQWSATRPTFGSMSELAASMKKLNVRPGIWMRPLIDEIKAWPDSWHMSRDRNLLDPTLPEVKQVIADDIKRLRGWGYEMIKHDFSTVDITGRWGREMRDGSITSEGWSFQSRAQTTAEIINDLYRTIRDAAGPAVVIGCNTLSHMTAGVFELNRIGDDTSGNEWHRNPQMGVNCLAFRAAQHGAFYGADADCVPITTRIEWKRTRQWLDLVARSGTPLFISLQRKAATPEVRKGVEAALTAAAAEQPLGEPLDWMESQTPRRWKLNGQTVTYDWS
ncbi:MAG: alpha-galactosidase [Humisphaera sp.]|nr:alpha-galactosidase [Humisphaera sp.]